LYNVGYVATINDTIVYESTSYPGVA